MPSARSVVAVFPADELTARRSLFDALAALYDVQFEKGHAARPELDGAIVIGPDTTATARLQTAGVPSLVVASEGGRLGTAPSRSVSFTDEPAVPALLRRRTMREEAAAGSPPLSVPERGGVLATSDEGPVWTVDKAGPAPTWHAAHAPPDLRPGEPMKRHLEAGRFLALLPFVHFLGGLGSAAGWTQPPLRASFIVDDPNLRRTTYGFLNYRTAAEHAERCGYHVGIAMVPLDASIARPAVTAMFRASPFLSVLVHGNNHERSELGRADSPGQRLALAVEALQRVDAFERKHGVRVARVMVPPHNACTEAMMEALAVAGFEGLCYRDLDGERPTPTRGWHPADFESAGGLPVVQRALFGVPVDELVLRALLGHPLVLAGHHVDFKDGMELLDAAAERVNGLGNVSWLRMDDVLRTNFFSRRSGTTLHVRPWSRLMHVDATDADALVVEPTASDEQGQERVLVHRVGGGPALASGSAGEVISVPSEPVVVKLDYDTRRPAVRGGRRRAWPVLRRRLIETRDRLLPVVSR